MSVFKHLPEHKQAAVLEYFKNKEQADISETQTDARAYSREDGIITVAETGYGWINSDTTCADLFGGDSRDGR